MVRFARADGSKGSNKRVLEEATPWSDIVAQRNDTVEKVSEEKKPKKRKKQNLKDGESTFITEAKEDDKDKKQLKITDNEKLDITVQGEKENEIMQAVTSTSEAGKKKKKKKDKKNVTELKQEFTINSEGQRVKVFKNGIERPWIDLPYEDNERMTRYDNMWVKREMVEKLDQLKASLKEGNHGEQEVMRKLMKAKRKAHRALRIELMYEQKKLISDEKQVNTRDKSITKKLQKANKKVRKSKKKSIKDENDQVFIDNDENVKKEDPSEKAPNLVGDDFTGRLGEGKEDCESKGDVSVTKCFEQRYTPKRNKKMKLRNWGTGANSIKVENCVLDNLNLQNENQTVPRISEGNPRASEENPLASEENPHVSEEIPRTSEENPQVSEENPLVFEENDVMTQFDGFWVKREAVERLTSVKTEKLKTIYSARTDGNEIEELTREEQITFQRAMKKEKLFENRKLLKELRGRRMGGLRKSPYVFKFMGGSDSNHSHSVKDNSNHSHSVNDNSRSKPTDSEVVKFDGFWVKKESASRLHKLRAQLTSEGVSEEELQMILRKERRKEERFLKNERKLLCLKCRKPGHMVSACPEVSEDTKEGQLAICYTCGSTEHTSRECSVKRKGSVYPHAKCFICGDMGHISRECPDNPRGLYPNGGACRGCGSVEHFVKDCPDLQKEHEESNIKMNRIDGTAIEALDFEEPDTEMGGKVSVDKTNNCKVVKF